MAIVVSSNQNYLQDRRQSSNVINRISIDIIQYKAAIAALNREARQHHSKEATFMTKSISVKATAASRLDKWKIKNTRADDLADKLSKAHHKIVFLQKELNEK